MNGNMQPDGFNGMDTDNQAPSGGASGANGHPKRVRVLLSCHPCRNSKLKCDRATPCGQCLRKGKPDGCLYAPRPEKRKPAKTMAARLKRLEGSMYSYLIASSFASYFFSLVHIVPSFCPLYAPRISKVDMPRAMSLRGWLQWFAR